MADFNSINLPPDKEFKLMEIAECFRDLEIENINQVATFAELMFVAQNVVNKKIKAV